MPLVYLAQCLVHNRCLLMAAHLITEAIEIIEARWSLRISVQGLDVTLTGADLQSEQFDFLLWAQF